jgi:hypothetical protein
VYFFPILYSCFRKLHDQTNGRDAHRYSHCFQQLALYGAVHQVKRRESSSTENENGAVSTNSKPFFPSNGDDFFIGITQVEARNGIGNPVCPTW